MEPLNGIFNSINLCQTLSILLYPPPPFLILLSPPPPPPYARWITWNYEMRESKIFFM